MTFQAAFQNCFSLNAVGRLLAFSFFKEAVIIGYFFQFCPNSNEKKKLRIKIHGNSHNIKRSLNLTRMAVFTILAPFFGFGIKFRKTLIT